MRPHKVKVEYCHGAGVCWRERAILKWGIKIPVTPTGLSVFIGNPRWRSSVYLEISEIELYG